MKSFVLIAILSLGISAAIADTEFPTIPVMNKPMKEMTQSELRDFYAKRRAAIEALPQDKREAYQEKIKTERLEHTGGMIIKTEGKGRIVYANLQTSVPTEDIAKPMNILGKYLRISIDTLNVNADSVSNIQKYLLDNKAKAVVLVVDNTTDPAILVAPEDKWAKVNIGKLKDRNVKNRTKMELLRAFCYLCGGIGSEYSNPLTGFIGNPTQLDDSPVAELPLDVVNRFTPYLKQLGVIPYVETTYRKACREGWAPAPTNEYQKAVWDKVHQLPTEPLTIKPETKPVKE